MSINYNDTNTCQSNTDCNINGNNNDLNSQWMCYNNKCIKTCISDSDCNIDENTKYCMYDSLLGNNKCIDNNYETLSKGCIVDDNIENAITNKNTSSLDKCVSWARNQTCANNGIFDTKCEYVIYKEKTETPINLETIKANIQCTNNNTKQTKNSKFKNACSQKLSDNNTKCNMDVKSILVNTIDDLKNNDDCTGYKLNYSYSCTNDPNKIEKSIDISNLDTNKNNPYNIEFTCPSTLINKSTLNPVCMTANLSNISNISNSSTTNCKYQVYNNPFNYTESQINEIYKINNPILEKELIEDINYNDDNSQEILRQTLMSNLELQQNDSMYINKLENEKIMINKENLDKLDKDINNLTNNIYKSQKIEQLNVKIIYFLSIFFGIIFLITVLIFIFVNIKKYKKI
jgi:hypothetical protein